MIHSRSQIMKLEMRDHSQFVSMENKLQRGNLDVEAYVSFYSRPHYI